MSEHRGIVVVIVAIAAATACEKQRLHSPSTSIMSLLKEAVWAILFLPPMELVCGRDTIRHNCLSNHISKRARGTRSSKEAVWISTMRKETTT